MPDRRRRRLSHAAIHLTAALGLFVVASTGLAAYRHSTYLTAALIPSILLLMTSHALLAREIRRHELIERALHDTNRELESFSYSVSHDLRSPLRSIDGFSQALVEDAGPALDDESRGHLDRIRNATLVTGYSLGANSYIRKPVDFQEFLVPVRRLGLYWLLLNQPAPHPPS